MQPYKVSFYIYADSPTQAQSLEQALYNFVETRRKKGIAVCAERLIEALSRYSNNFFVNQFLRQK